MSRTALAPRSLAGLYGSKKRRQTVRTPQWFREAVCTAFGVARIPLDPCAHPSPRYHFAEENWSSKGLARAWNRPAFVNSPWKYLGDWMAYAWAEQRRTHLPLVLLGPWRSHRLTFLPALRGGTVHFFRAFPFEGETDGTPFACFAVAFNCTFPETPYELDRKDW